jgi:hypothetical protein
VSDFSAGEVAITKFLKMGKFHAEDGNISFTFANFSLGGVKDITNGTQIIICSSGIGFLSENEFPQN